MCWMIPSTKQEEAKQIEAMTLAKKAWLDGLFPLFIGKMVGAPDGTLTPLKINMKHNHGGLEDLFPF